MCRDYIVIHNGKVEEVKGKLKRHGWIICLECGVICRHDSRLDLWGTITMEGGENDHKRRNGASKDTAPASGKPDKAKRRGRSKN